MPDVFVSYSRTARDFVRALCESLKQHGREVWVDWEGIPPSAEWEQEVYAAIDASQSLVFVIDAESVKSGWCLKEIGHATERNKRLIPLLREDVAHDLIPVALRKLNWIHARDQDEFDAAFAQLTKALDTDLDYLRAHTRLLTRAVDWDRQQEKSLLLTGRDLEGAEQWLVQGGKKDPRPTALHAQFIQSSRQKATQGVLKMLGVSVVVMAVIAVLAVVAWLQRNAAIANETRALAGRLAADSRYELVQRPQLALLLAAAAVDLEPLGPAGGAVLSATLAHPRLDAFVERLDSHVEQLAFGPGRALAALTHDQTLVVWHDDGRRSVLWRRSNDESQSPFTRLAFTENGKRLAAAAENGDVLFWDLERNEPLPTVESGGTIASLAFSADGTRIAIGAADGAIAVWKIGTDRPLETLQSLPSSTSQHTLTFVGDSLRALTVTADALEIWDVTSGGRILVESDSPTLAPGAVLAWNGQSIAHANAQEVVIRPEITERAVVRIPLTITQGGISSLALSRDLKQVATGGQDGSVILWRVSDTNALGEWLVRGERQLRNLAWSHDGRRIAAIAEERTFLQWDVQEPRAQREIRSGAPLAGKAFTVHSLAFGPAEKLMAAVETDSVVSLVDVETGKPASAQGVSHDGGTSVVAIAADAKLVAAGGRDGQILLWNASTGGLRTTLEGRDTPPIKEGYGDPATEQTVITALAFSPDERRLVSVSGETASGARTIDMILWDLALSEPRPQRISQSPPVTAAAFNPTGTILALAAERDGMTTVTLWDTTQWRAVGQPWPDLRGVSSVAFSPDGKRLAMSTSEGIFLGDVDPRSWQQRACVMANRNFSCEEWRESVGTRPYKTVCPTLSSPRCESP